MTAVAVAEPQKKKGHRKVSEDMNADAKEVPDFIRFRKLEQHPCQLVVHKSRIHGMGVYTLAPIRQHDFIIEYQVLREKAKSY